MPLPKQGGKKICFDNCGNGIVENEKKKKKNCFGNCGNLIAKNGKKKFLAIVAMTLPKMGEKKKKMLRNL